MADDTSRSPFLVDTPTWATPWPVLCIGIYVWVHGSSDFGNKLRISAVVFRKNFENLPQTRLCQRDMPVSVQEPVPSGFRAVPARFAPTCILVQNGSEEVR